MILGGIYAFFSEKVFDFQKLVGKKVMGISYKASPKTFKMYKVIDLVFVVIGLLILFGYI